VSETSSVEQTMPLAYVIWGIGLLSYIAVSLLWTGNVSYQLARNVTEGAQLEATFEAAINRAVLGLLDPRYDRRWRVDGVVQDFSFGSARVRVAIQDELGRIDLNHADEELLTGLFRSVGLDSFSASRLVDKILDWRDSNGLKHLNGVTAEDYRAARLAYRPRNGPFQNVDELQLVMDMTPELFRRVEPALTVYSGRQFIDPQFAPREALLALPAMNADAAGAAVATRANQAAGSTGARPGVIDPIVPLQGRAFTIRADIERLAGTISREVGVRITDNPVQPYWVIGWKAR
jgi:general secretion pathway protein K